MDGFADEFDVDAPLHIKCDHNLNRAVELYLYVILDTTRNRKLELL